MKSCIPAMVTTGTESWSEVTSVSLMPAPSGSCTAVVGPVSIRGMVMVMPPSGSGRLGSTSTSGRPLVRTSA